jgi:hypothetical protein
MSPADRMSRPEFALVGWTYLVTIEGEDIQYCANEKTVRPPPLPPPAWSCPARSPKRRTRCGRPNCACHADPPRLHDPYWQWTRKIAAKTVCRWLSPDQHRDYTPWIDNDRRLHELLARLETLGAVALDADPAGNARHAARPAKPKPKPPGSVGCARLTCGRPSTQPSYTQLRAGRGRSYSCGERSTSVRPSAGPPAHQWRCGGGSTDATN